MAEHELDADVSPRGWNQAFDRHGQPDGDYLRNRIARLTFDLKTGEAQIEK